MKKLICVLGSIILFTCSKTDDLHPVVFDVSFDFAVFNTQNEDLLDPATTKHYDNSQIKLFYKENDGEIIEVYESHLDFPRHFRIYKHENEYRISVGLNSCCIPDNSTTYIQWTENDLDTVEAQFEKSRGSILMRKVWLNESEIWDWTANEDQYFKMNKVSLE